MKRVIIVISEAKKDLVHHIQDNKGTWLIFAVAVLFLSQKIQTQNDVRSVCAGHHRSSLISFSPRTPREVADSICEDYDADAIDSDDNN